jgi:hypothetical protein
MAQNNEGIKTALLFKISIINSPNRGGKAQKNPDGGGHEK